MNNPNEDPLLDEPDTLADFDDNGDFAEFDQKKSGANFGSMMQNPLVKIGMVVAALIIVIGSIMMFGGNKTETPDSVVGSGSDVKETPGTAEVSPEMKQALEEENQQRIEQAVQTGDSVLPTPIDPPKDRLPVPEQGTGEEDPLLRWRQMQEQRNQEDQQTLQAAQQQQQIQKQAQADQRAAALAALTSAMTSQMSQVITDPQAQALKYMEVTDLNALISAMRAQEEEKQQAAVAQYQQVAAANASPAMVNGQLIDPATGQEVAAPKVLIKAGTIEYGQIMTEANSDIPGPVLATIASGKFSGSKLIGSFTRNEEYLMITFSTLVDKKGVSIPIQAYALDPNTTLSGMATDVDNRYWQRVIWPAAAQFVAGMGSAIAESGSTNVTVNGETVTTSQNDIDTKQEIYKGVEKAAERVSDILDEKASKTQPLVRVAAGTPLGILFTTSVTDQDRLIGKYNPSATGYNRAGNQQQGNANNGGLLQQQLLQGSGGASTTDMNSLLQSLRDLQNQQNTTTTPTTTGK